MPHHELNLTVLKKPLGLSDLQRICFKSSREIEELAPWSGCQSMPGQPVTACVGTALNMLVLSKFGDHGIEARSVAPWLPGLRDEALLELGVEISNWTFDGPREAEQRFWPMLYGTRDAVRPRIGTFLRCYSGSPIRQLRFFSLSDVESLTNSQVEQSPRGRTPRFTIDAHALASQIQATCGSPLFTARAVAVR